MVDRNQTVEDYPIMKDESVDKVLWVLDTIGLLGRNGGKLALFALIAWLILRSIEATEQFAFVALLVAMALLAPGDKLTIITDKRSKILSNAELEEFEGERGRRGLKLPRLYRDIVRVEVVPRGQSNKE